MGLWGLHRVIGYIECAGEPPPLKNDSLGEGGASPLKFVPLGRGGPPPAPRAFLAPFLNTVFRMQPYHTLKVSESLLLNLVKVSVMPGAKLSHFEGVRVTFTQSF